MWTLVFYLYELLLLAYAGWRTVDFMQNQLPKGLDGNMASILSIAFLAATEMGLILWSFLSRKDANSKAQEAIADTLTAVDFIASFLAGLADMIITQTLMEGYSLPPLLGVFLLYFLPIVVAMNVGAGLLYKRFDANEALARKTQQVNYAKQDAQLTILDTAIVNLKSNRGAIAATASRDIARSLATDAVATVKGEYGLGDSVELPDLVTPESDNRESLLTRLRKRGDGHNGTARTYNGEADGPKNP